MNTILPRHPIRETIQQPQPPPMTIVIGFIHSGGVVMASDSQASYFPSTRKDPDVQKIISVKLSNGGHALIGRSGSLDAADYFQEFFEASAATTPITTARTVADMAEQALKEARNRFVAQFRNNAFDADDLKTHLLNYQCELMIGYIFNQQSYIYTLTLDGCIASKNNRQFRAIGSGSNVADFVLAGINLTEQLPFLALGIAAYTIEACKEHDSACGGRTQLGMAAGNNGEGCEIVPPSITEQFERVGRNMDRKIRKAVSEVIPAAMKEENLLNQYSTPSKRKPRK